MPRLLLLFTLLPALAAAQNLSPLIEATALSHASGLPGEVQVRVSDARPALPPCAQAQAFMPPGSKPWGEVLVGVRCPGPEAWTRFVPVQIQVQVRHAVAAVALPAGHRLLGSDVQWLQADLARLPRDAVLDERGVVGAVSLQSLAPGAPLRRDGLKIAPVIVQGQSVKVQVLGPGFVLGTEGKAQTPAIAGQPLQLRLASGQLISAVAQPDGTAQK